MPPVSENVIRSYFTGFENYPSFMGSFDARRFLLAAWDAHQLAVFALLQFVRKDGFTALSAPLGLKVSLSFCQFFGENFTYVQEIGIWERKNPVISPVLAVNHRGN